MASNLWCSLTVILILLPLSLSCLNGWRQSSADSTKCYLISVSKKIWFEAEMFCSNAAPNAHLTSIASAFELYNINANVIDTSSISACDQMWIGANNFDQKDQFTWIDGKPFEYSNWEPGQPDPNNQCVSSQARNSGTWRTQSCGIENCFICESYASAITTTTHTVSSSQLTTTTLFPPSTIATTLSLPPLICNIKTLKYVIYVVLDDSSAVSVYDYDLLRTIMSNFVSGYTISGNNVLLALVTVSSVGRLRTFFGTLNETLYELANHPKTGTNGQNLNEAFYVIEDVFILNNMAPQGFPQLLIYVSGTTDFSQGGAPYGMADTLSRAGIQFVAVQYGPQADSNVLSTLAGGADCVYSAVDSASRAGMAAWLQNKTCNEDYCKMVYTSESTTASPTSRTTSPLSSCPQDMIYDVFLILDQSRNANAAQFSEMKEFLVSFATNFTFSPTYSQFSISSVSDYPGMISELGEYNSIARLAATIRTQIQTQSMDVNLQQMLTIIKGLTTHESYRPNAHHLILYITSASFSDDPFALAAELRNDKGIGFLTVAYGDNADVDKLTQLSGGSECVIRAGIAGVSLNDAVQAALKKTCSLQFCDTSPAG